MRLLFPFLVALGLLGCHQPAQPLADFDDKPARAAQHCDSPRNANEKEVCRIFDELDSAHAFTEWPSGGEIQAWLGVDHCAEPTAGPDFDSYELVYLRASKGSAPNAAIDPGHILAYSAIFASLQVNRKDDSNTADTMRALATGSAPDESKAKNAAKLITKRPPDEPFQTLVKVPSGVSVSDGSPELGIRFLRFDGAHLLLFAPKLQSGCVSELYRVPLEVAAL